MARKSYRRRRTHADQEAIFCIIAGAVMLGAVLGVVGGIAAAHFNLFA